jgi:peptidoglycan/xylan/chitin deacetylase (PgdA/CDA1 family)
MALLLLPTICQAKDRRIPIVCYHHIASDLTRSNLYLKPEIFRSHLDWLQANGYETVTFKDVLELGPKLPKNPIILTFDDAPEDHWNVYKELKSRGMRGVFFVVTGRIGKSWLTESKIREMGSNGMEIGSHTVTHKNLTKIPLADMQYELNYSKHTLEQILGTKVIVLAYPYGKYDETLLSNMRVSDYIYGRTTDEFITTWGVDRNFRLPAVLIRRNTKNLEVIK